MLYQTDLRRQERKYDEKEVKSLFQGIGDPKTIYKEVNHLPSSSERLYIQLK